MSEERKAVVRRFYEIYNSGELDRLDEVMSAGYVSNDPQGPDPQVAGLEAVKAQLRLYREAFPDLRFSVEEQVCEGDAVATRWTVTGTQEGDLPNLPATGRRASVTGISIDHFGPDGKMADGYTNWDTLGMLQQLGAAPGA
jgi:steroid delta-isomerase-like uncharacterized protein